MNHCFRIPSFTKSSWNLSGGLVCIFSLVNSPISDHDIEVSTWFYLTKHTDTSNPPKNVSRFFPCACRISVNIKYTSNPPPKKVSRFSSTWLSNSLATSNRLVVKKNLLSIQAWSFQASLRASPPPTGGPCNPWAREQAKGGDGTPIAG